MIKPNLRVTFATHDNQTSSKQLDVYVPHDGLLLIAWKRKIKAEILRLSKNVTYEDDVYIFKVEQL